MAIVLQRHLNIPFTWKTSTLLGLRGIGASSSSWQSASLRLMRISRDDSEFVSELLI